MQKGKYANERVAFLYVCLPDMQITNDEQLTSQSFNHALFSLPGMTAALAALPEWHMCGFLYWRVSSGYRLLSDVADLFFN